MVNTNTKLKEITELKDMEMIKARMEYEENIAVLTKNNDKYRKMYQILVNQYQLLQSQCRNLTAHNKRLQLSAKQQFAQLITTHKQQMNEVQDEYKQKMVECNSEFKNMSDQHKQLKFNHGIASNATKIMESQYHKKAKSMNDAYNSKEKEIEALKRKHRNYTLGEHISDIASEKVDSLVKLGGSLMSYLGAKDDNQADKNPAEN